MRLGLVVIEAVAISTSLIIASLMKSPGGGVSRDKDSTSSCHKSLQNKYTTQMFLEILGIRLMDSASTHKYPQNQHNPSPEVQIISPSANAKNEKLKSPENRPEIEAETNSPSSLSQIPKLIHGSSSAWGYAGLGMEKSSEGRTMMNPNNYTDISTLVMSSGKRKGLRNHVQSPTDEKVSEEIHINISSFILLLHAII